MRSLAWRNIWRQRSRSLTSVGAVAVVVFFTLFDFGMMGAVRDGFYGSLTDVAGHIQVHVRNYRDIREFRESLIRDAAALTRQIGSVTGAAHPVGVLEVPALVAGETRARGAQIVGLDQPPVLRDRFARNYLGGGRMLGAGERDAILLGTALARTLQVDLGSTVYVYAPGTEGVGAAAYTVVGLIRLPDALAEARLAYLSLAAAQELAAPDAVSRLELHLPQYRRITDEPQVADVEEAVRAAVGDRYSVEAWREFNPALAQLFNVITPFILIFTAILFVLAGLMVINTVYLNLMERIREFGVIMALGAGRRAVATMVLWESLWLCVTGAVAGTALGLALVWYLGRGFSLPAVLSELTSAFGYPRVLYTSIQPAEIAITAAFVLVTGILAAWWPTRVAGTLQPVEAMRFVP